MTIDLRGDGASAEPESILLSSVDFARLHAVHFFTPGPERFPVSRGDRAAVIQNVLALHWIRASDLQRSILADIHHQQPSLPPRSTLILDGVCPYVGPAIVFESRWDLRGALRVMYRDSSIDADVATRRMVVTPQELSTEIYSDVYRYPFRDGLLVYDYRRRRAYPLTDSEAARRYFADRPFSPPRDCPPGREGLGAPAW
jgi:hypothetical protein